MLVEEGTRDSRREVHRAHQGDDHRRSRHDQPEGRRHLSDGQFRASDDVLKRPRRGVDRPRRSAVAGVQQPGNAHAARLTTPNLGAWIGGGGDAIFLNFLLQRDISSFNPNAAPPPYGRRGPRSCTKAGRRSGRTSMLFEKQVTLPFHRRPSHGPRIFATAVAGARQGTLGLQEAGAIPARHRRGANRAEACRPSQAAALGSSAARSMWAEAAEARVAGRVHPRARKQPVGRNGADAAGWEACRAF